MSIEISVAIIAICFVLLLLIGFLFSLILIIGLFKSIKKINQTQSSLRADLQPVLNETSKTVAHVNQITENIKTKLEMTTPLFTSIAKTGQLMENALDKMNQEIEKPQKIISFSEEPQKKFNIQDWIEWLALGVILWKKIKRRRKND
jgi:uncharacterized protein YoxC